MYRSLWTSRAEDPLRGACALAGRPLRLHQGGACTARARMAPVARATRTGDRPRRVPFLVFLLRFGRDFLSYLSFPTLSVANKKHPTRIATSRRERRSTDDTWSDRTWDKSETRPSRAHRTGCRCRVCPRACGTPRPGCHWEIGWPLRSPTPLGLGLGPSYAITDPCPQPDAHAFPPEDTWPVLPLAQQQHE